MAMIARDSPGQARSAPRSFKEPVDVFRHLEASAAPRETRAADLTCAALRWRAITTLEGLKELIESPAFAALHGTVFHAGPWILSLARSMAGRAGTQFHVVVGYDGKRPLIVMPLSTSARFGIRRLGWLGEGVDDYSAPLVHPELSAALTQRFAEEAWQKAIALVGGADFIAAGHQPSRIAGTGNPFARYRSVPEAESCHAATLGADWPALESDLISNATRKRLREKRRALGRVGAVSLDLLRTPQAIEHGLDLLTCWKSAQLETRGSSNPFRNDAFVRILRDAAAGDEAQENVRLYALSVAGRAYAVAMILVSGDHWLLYQTAYDHARSRRYSAGQLLILDLLREATEAGAGSFDFGFGDDAYKQRFCNRTIELTKSVWAVSALGSMALTVQLAAARARTALKRSPLGYGLAMRLRRIVSGPAGTSPASAVTYPDATRERTSAG